MVIGVPDTRALLRAAERCSLFEIPHYVWSEPDFDYGTTAITTAAISGPKRQAFAEYRTWKEFSPVAQSVEQRILIPPVESSTLSR